MAPGRQAREVCRHIRSQLAGHRFGSPRSGLLWLWAGRPAMAPGGAPLAIVPGATFRGSYGSQGSGTATTFLMNLLFEVHHEDLSVPVLALEGLTPDGASIAAAPPGHISCLGGRVGGHIVASRALTSPGRYQMADRVAQANFNATGAGKGRRANPRPMRYLLNNQCCGQQGPGRIGSTPESIRWGGR